MTTTDRTAEPDAAFAARLAGVEAADADPDGCVEKVARAMWDAFPARELLGAWDEQSERDKTPTRRAAMAAIHALQAPAEFDPSAGYTVELGGQMFTQAQWEALQPYIEGRAAAGSEDAATWTPALVSPAVSSHGDAGTPGTEVAE